VALNEKVKSYINGSKTLVVGFGMHSLDNDDDTGFLRSFETEIYRTYKDVDVSSFKKVAIPSNYDDGACVGDSGGPAFVQRGGQLVQVGIGQGSLEIDTKKKFACNQKSLGYTDIASYLPWILQTRIELEATLEANLVTPGINTK
jgi:secreted trypsin-like serine protease